MLKRKEITDLSATGHPWETARLIIAALKNKKYKSKAHIEDRHVIHIHFDKNKDLINIDVEEISLEEKKLIAMSIPYKTAVSQAYTQQQV